MHLERKQSGEHPPFPYMTCLVKARDNPDTAPNRKTGRTQGMRPALQKLRWFPCYCTLSRMPRALMSSRYSTMSFFLM